MKPTPLAHWPLADRARIHGVLTDIDDTLTADGALAPEALDALLRLRAAGLPVLAVTGRPVGWSEPFALAWPIDAIVAENGAVALWNEGGELHRAYAQDSTTRKENFRRIQAAALAPAEPSGQDFRVAAQGRALEAEGRKALAREQREAAAELLQARQNESPGSAPAGAGNEAVAAADRNPWRGQASAAAAGSVANATPRLSVWA